MAPTTNEFLALLPISLLGFTIFVRARFLYNRADNGLLRLEGVQKRILFYVLPVWVFLTWIQKLQVKYDGSVALLSTLGVCTLQYYIWLAILNDSFNQSRTQIISLLLAVLSAYAWVVTDLLIYS
tara:strand:- start:263 stop:637 length:375 start_codon:yes stop_codon:yes gene_type:complete